MTKRKRSKFNVDQSKSGTKKRTVGALTFDSQIEANYYTEVLLPLQKEGIVVSIETQKEFVLQPGFIKNGKKYLPILYYADFFVEYKDGHTEVVDIKGMVLPDFMLKKKMFEYVYSQYELLLIGYSKIDGGFVSLDVIKKGRAKRKKAKNSA